METPNKKQTISEWFDKQAKKADEQSEKLNQAGSSLNKAGNKTLSAGFFIILIVGIAIYFCTCK
jgi:hypothetical protein